MPKEQFLCHVLNTAISADTRLQKLRLDKALFAANTVAIIQMVELH